MIEGEKREVIKILLIVMLLFVVLIPLLYLRGSHPQNTLLVPPQERSKPVLSPVLQDDSTVRMMVGNAEVVAEVAVSREKKAKGLSARDGLEAGKGMLFVFDQKEVYTFWNQDMRFPIDVIWIDQDTVRDVHENVPVFSGTPVTISPSAAVNFVLEVNKGFVKAHGIKAGDKVKWNKEN